MPRHLPVILRRWLPALCALALLACTTLTAPLLGRTPTPPPTQPPPSATASLNPSPTAPPTPTAGPPPAPAGWPPPAVDAPGGLVAGPASAAEQAAAARLLAAEFPPADYVRLAEALGGAHGPIARQTASEPAAWQVGDRADFWVLNNDTVEFSQASMELRAVGEHAYLWFDRSTRQVSEAAASQAAQTFDEVYERDRALFGSEPNPGIDGDPRVYILHTGSDRMGGGGLLGYMDDASLWPQAALANSNEHESFVLNVDYLDPGSLEYAETLAHEFQHMIFGNYDRSDTDWMVEGSAVYAEDALGYGGGALGFVGDYLRNPDQPLNMGVDVAHYGYGFLFIRYVAGRFGQEFVRGWLQRPDDGLPSLDAALAEAGLGVTAAEAFDGWLAANLIGGDEQAPPEYRHPGLRFRPVRPDEPGSATAKRQSTVNQYNADYYALAAGQHVEFRGAGRVRPIPAGPHSGASYWWTARANQSDVTLTREFDLSGVTSATLRYWAWFDIEEGWDYGYLLASTDGGDTWQGLQTPGMSEFDPQQKTYTDRAYTGDSGGAWLQEIADLTPYAGGRVLVRFEYLTDAILTRHGLALDDFSIPEIGFYDDAETDGGWQAAGFSQVTAYLPQAWSLQLVTHAGGVPQVARVELADGVSAAFDAPGEAVLIIAGLAPFTLEEAVYELTVE